MHELGILNQVIGVVEKAADRKFIRHIRHITLEVGYESGVVPLYLKKLFPLAAEAVPLLKNTELRIRMVCGRGLVIKDIGY